MASEGEIMRVKIRVKLKDGDTLDQIVKFSTEVNIREYIVKVFSREFALIDIDENNGILIRQTEICSVYWAIVADE